MNDVLPMQRQPSINTTVATMNHLDTDTVDGTQCHQEEWNDGYAMKEERRPKHGKEKKERR